MGNSSYGDFRWDGAYLHRYGDLDERRHVLFPGCLFYEFLPEYEMNKVDQDPNYKPRTMLMNEVVTGNSMRLC